jgi:hypothetical protein
MPYSAVWANCVSPIAHCSHLEREGETRRDGGCRRAPPFFLEATCPWWTAALGGLERAACLPWRDLQTVLAALGVRRIARDRPAQSEHDHTSCQRSFVVCQHRIHCSVCSTSTCIPHGSGTPAVRAGCGHETLPATQFAAAESSVRRPTRAHSQSRRRAHQDITIGPPHGAPRTLDCGRWS